MAILSMNEILSNEVLENLEGSEAILVNSVMNMTASVKPGADRVTVPKVSGYALASITSGSRAASDSVTTTGTVLLLDQVKQVHEYVSWANGIDSKVDLQSAFIANSPKYYVKGIEALIAAKLATASALDFDSASATAGVFSVSDIAKCKKLLDQNNVPKTERFLSVNAEAMEILSSFAEFQDGSKSLSAEALRMGIVSMVKGFNVIQSEDIAGTGATLKFHAYHKSAVAFAQHAGLEFINKDIEEYGESFMALRGKHGCIDLDNASGSGVRKITVLCSTDIL